MTRIRTIVLTYTTREKRRRIVQEVLNWSHYVSSYNRKNTLITAIEKLEREIKRESECRYIEKQSWKKEL